MPSALIAGKLSETTLRLVEVGTIVDISRWQDTIFNDRTLIGKIKTEDKNSAHLFHLLCINALCTHLFEPVRDFCMHNKCMKLHTEIKFSKPAHPQCDAHVIS